MRTGCARATTPHTASRNFSCRVSIDADSIVDVEALAARAAVAGLMGLMDPVFLLFEVPLAVLQLAWARRCVPWRLQGKPRSVERQSFLIDSAQPATNRGMLNPALRHASSSMERSDAWPPPHLRWTPRTGGSERRRSGDGWRRRYKLIPSLLGFNSTRASTFVTDCRPGLFDSAHGHPTARRPCRASDARPLSA